MFDSPRGDGSGVIILGIDPGLLNTGWGVVESEGARLRCVAYGCITTRSADPLPERLAQVHDEIGAAIARYSPAECALESVFFGTNAKSAFATGQARGAAIMAMCGRGLALGEYSPVQVKKAVVGAGRAEKDQVAYMVRVLLGLPDLPKPDHAADALAVAICHAHSREGHALAGASR
ncbi:MAG: crossover junction endodeoxyribonuclease RuvC [Coriobacteriaceae bacterium]|nr:crossover junction endodeoxyribonuclease RuvC [Coriobacteriaceae bacterium]